jgi:uncharacterized membrane protein
MKLTVRDKGKEIPVMVISENMIRYGVVIGTSNNLIGILLNTGDYIDEPVSRVRRIHKFKK